MRRGFLIAVLLGTTALVPAPAHAGVVLPLVQGIVAGIAGTPLLGGAGAVFTQGIVIGANANLFFGTALGRLLLQVGASALLDALAPRPNIPQPAERQQNFSQPISFLERGYGEVRKGGPQGFRSGIVDNRRHLTVLIAAHPTEGPVTHYLDQTEVTFDGSGDVQTAPMNDGGTPYVNLRTYTGQPGQVADPVLVAAFDEFTSAHDYAGLSYAALRFKAAGAEKGLTIYNQGREHVYAPVWRMWNEIYDPRNESTGYTNNWALCFAHELTEIWGLQVDWDEVATEADACDQLVTNRDGGQQRKWTFNNLFTDDQDFQSVLAAFLAAADGMIWEGADGKVRFRSGRYVAPTVTLGPEDFLSVAVSQSQGGLNPPTRYFAEYVEPQRDWIETPSADYEVENVAKHIRRRIQIYGINSHNQAIRAIKRLALSERAELRFVGEVGLIGYELVGQRFVNIDHDMLGYSGPVEIVRLRAREDGAAFEIEARAVTPEEFDFDAATEEPAPPKYNADDVSGDDPIDAPTGFTGSAVTGTGGVAAVLWQWDALDESLSPTIRIRESGGEWESLDLPPGETQYTATGLIDGVTYEAQLRARTAAYRVSDWAPGTPVSVQAVANSDPPDDLVAFAVSETGGDATVTLTAPNDPVYFGTRIYRANYTAGYSGPYDIADASVIRLEYGAPNAADSYDDTGLATGHYAYWGVPINASGVAGTASGPETIDVT